METKTAISANELMLGNWVYLKFNTPTLDRVSYISDNTIGLANYGGEWELSEIEPIPLSAELLEKCGFVKHLDGMMYKWESKDFKEHAENGEAYPHLNMYLRRHLIPDNSYCFAYNNYRSYPFQYLHQLQNLALLLTGQQLTIEL